MAVLCNILSFRMCGSQIYTECSNFMIIIWYDVCIVSRTPIILLWFFDHHQKYPKFFAPGDSETLLFKLIEVNIFIHQYYITSMKRSRTCNISLYILSQKPSHIEEECCWKSKLPFKMTFRFKRIFAAFYTKNWVMTSVKLILWRPFNSLNCCSK